MGDFLAVDSLSKYTPSNWKEADSRLNAEIEIGRGVLNQIDDALKGVKWKYYLEGNHEQRLTKWICGTAFRLGQLQCMEVPSLLGLEKRKWRYIYLREQPLILGKANFIHGYYANEYHAAKTARETGRNVFYGHTHDHQVMYAKHMPSDKPHKAVSVGCLCKTDQSYIDSEKPTRWTHGIGIIEFFDDGCFTDYFLPIINYTVAFNGWVFRG